MKRVDLFVIDGQNDFCASGNEDPKKTNFFKPDPKTGDLKPGMGALFVQGADEEANRVAAMIDRLSTDGGAFGSKISKIHATLDSHHFNDGMHNEAWKCADGSTPPPFTMVTHDDVKNHRYVPRFAVAQWRGKPVQSYQWALEYTKELEKRGRNAAILWPVHCQMGDPGSAVYKPLMESYNRWCGKTNGWINFVTKGDFVFSEHYSAIEADVPDPQRKDTQLNAELVDDAAEADIIVWTGWAGSHCLLWTGVDASNKFGSGQLLDGKYLKEGDNEFLKKSVFMEDASAPVVNPFDNDQTKLFADWRKKFLDEVVSKGATVTTTDQFLKAA